MLNTNYLRLKDKIVNFISDVIKLSMTLAISCKASDTEMTHIILYLLSLFRMYMIVSIRIQNTLRVPRRRIRTETKINTRVECTSLVLIGPYCSCIVDIKTMRPCTVHF